MNQDEINQTEWKNDANWGGPRWGSIYFSKRDTRVWVPKRMPWLGWTVNLAHNAGVYWFIGLLMGAPLAVIIVLFTVLIITLR